MTRLAGLGTLLMMLLPECAATAAPVEAFAGIAESLSRARQLAVARRFDEAVALYDEVLREAPELWDASLGRAEALVWGGRYRAAALAYRELLVRRPGSIEALRGLARAAYWSGDFRRALTLFSQ
ncbi:MAG: tetratricopeptide repeat protein, partial [Thermoanaerobaculia bacterium]